MIFNYPSDLPRFLGVLRFHSALCVSVNYQYWEQETPTDPDEISDNHAGRGVGRMQMSMSLDREP